jgi:hypothetical protein
MLDLAMLALDHGDPPRSSFEDDLICGLVAGIVGSGAATARRALLLALSATRVLFGILALGPDAGATRAQWGVLRD